MDAIIEWPDGRRETLARQGSKGYIIYAEFHCKSPSCGDIYTHTFERTDERVDGVCVYRHTGTDRPRYAPTECSRKSPIGPLGPGRR